MNQLIAHCPTCMCTNYKATAHWSARLPEHINGVVVPALCKALMVTLQQIAEERRTQRMIQRRMFIIWWLRTEHKLSFPLIGNVIDRDHTTVIYFYKKAIKTKAAESWAWKEIIARLPDEARATPPRAESQAASAV